MQTKHISIILVGVVLAGACGFYGGTLFAKPRAGAGQGMQAQFGANGARNFRGGQGTGQMGRVQQGMASGEILSKDGQSLSLKLRDGGSKIIFLSASTTVSKLAEAKLDDVASGAEVTVAGTPNADGSITAQMIQIRPAGMAGFGFGTPGQQPRQEGGMAAPTSR